MCVPRSHMAKTRPPALRRRFAHCFCHLLRVLPSTFSSSHTSRPFQQPFTSGMPCAVPPLSILCQSTCGRFFLICLHKLLSRISNPVLKCLHVFNAQYCAYLVKRPKRPRAGHPALDASATAPVAVVARREAQQSDRHERDRG